MLCSVETLVYPFELSMISGARYQRVATYSVKKPVWSWSGSCDAFFSTGLGNDDGMVVVGVQYCSFSKGFGNNDGIVKLIICGGKEAFITYLVSHINQHKPKNINQEMSEGLTATRARPKSQIFRSQVVFSNKLLGFRSLQRTLTFAFHDMISMDF